MPTHLAAVPDDKSMSASISHETPVVFIVDDDVSVRESLELLIRSVGWRPETFESAQEFLLVLDRPFRTA